ncbi:hypothetical protein GQ54DRAFT_302918 [Martensiomyces pterosporus]|nr:hypothetical protein GQ54DRAFT_302918 [Martensiomyces pterosporus]
MSFFDAWSTVSVRGRTTGQAETFRVQCAGGYCATCDKCQHKCLLSPNMHKAPLCPHCGDVITLPLEAHFACPATLERQFAILRPFDIEQFLSYQAHELIDHSRTPGEPLFTGKGVGGGAGSWNAYSFVGFMDVTMEKLTQSSLAPSATSKAPDAAADTRSRPLVATKNGSSGSGGLWALLARMCSGAGTSVCGRRDGGSTTKRLLAVMTRTTLSWYTVRTPLLAGKGHNRPYERVCSVQLPWVQFSMHSSGKRVIVSDSQAQVRVEMDLGSGAVADMWLHALARNTTHCGTPTRNQCFRKQQRGLNSGAVFCDGVMADGYSSSCLGGDGDGDDGSDADTVVSLLDAPGNQTRSQVGIRLVPA